MTDLFVFNLKVSLGGELILYFNLIVIMSKTRNSKKISVQRERGKNENVEEASMNTRTLKVDLGNDSPHRSNESYISSHSTPIRKRDHVTYVEDSPELDYHYSPISLPCTQDAGNEIAWDWQTPVYKNLNEKPKTSTNHVETPKRTKLLQKKGNSNSPVLQKPLKGKQVTTENMENIGKLKAALKALDEKVKNIIKNDDNVATKKKDNRKREADGKLVVESDNDIDDDIMIVKVINNDNLKINSVPNNTDKKNDYEDLFDDSIDDSMVRCSQEIEKKLKLCNNDKSDIMEAFVLSEIKETSSTSETESRHLTTSNKSSSSSIFKTYSTSTSGHLRTYSNNSSKRNMLSSISVSSSKFCNNNVTNVSNEKQTAKDKSTSDFLDDSFDDCLATCMEDDKLLSKLSEYEFNPTKTGRNATSSKKNSKQVVSNSAITKKEAHQSTAVITDDLIGEDEAIADIDMIRKSLPSKSALENRKFFKTRSLSDHCFFKVNLLEKRFQSNNMPVSTFPTVRERGGDNSTVKYNSTSNLSSVKESQPVQCTPEEIERKRMEAKMRLEAKRKLQSGVGDTPSEVPVKRSVKR